MDLIVDETLKAVEKRALDSALTSAQTLGGAARQLGIGRTTLYRKIEKLGMQTSASKSATTNRPNRGFDDPVESEKDDLIVLRCQVTVHLHCETLA